MLDKDDLVHHFSELIKVDLAIFVLVAFIHDVLDDLLVVIHAFVLF